MSIERELLERVMSLIDYRYAQSKAITVHREIQELLAQPEHEQEPVAWMWANEELGGFYFSNIENPNWKPLYTAPPKREPLSESRIAAIWDDSDKTDVAITRAIEKAHGIGK